MSLTLFDEPRPPLSPSRVEFLAGMLATWLATDRAGMGARPLAVEREIARRAAEAAVAELASDRPVL